jgi:hypothetical protein
MGLTHLSGLAITPTASKGDATTAHALEINTSRLTTGRALRITKATTEKGWIGSGGQSQWTGTLTASGAFGVRKISTFNGTANFTGAKVRLQKWAELCAFTGGGSAIAGRRTITTGGSATIATKRIAATSLLFLTPGVNTGINNVVCYERRSARSAGTSFKVRMHQATGTAVTGVVHWLIVQPA